MTQRVIHSYAVKVKGLYFSHNGGDALPGLANLDFFLEPGRALCLAGVNGSGKSTLLGILAGLYDCRAECLEVFGHDMTGSEESRCQGAALAALLMQDPDMQILGATVAEDLLLGMPDNPDCRKRAMELAGRFALQDCLDTPCQHLSYGQKRKLCLATALMREPRLLLLDEPFSGLDYPAVQELRNILLALKQEGRSLIVSSHDLAPLLNFTDAVLYLSSNGETLFGPTVAMLPHAARMGVRPPGEFF